MSRNGKKESAELDASTLPPLPKGWLWQPMSAVCDKIQDGTHFSPKEDRQFSSGPYPYVTAKNVRPSGLDLTNITYLSEEDHRPIYDRCDARQGDVLLVKDGVNTGDAAINTYDGEISLLSSVSMLRPTKMLLLNRFLRYFLLSPVGYQSLTGQMTGTAIKRIVLRKIRETPVPVAPLNEQRRIVAKIEELFSDLDAGVAALERVRANLKRYRAAVLKAAVEGRLTAQWRVDAASRRVSNRAENRDVRPAESNEAESRDGNAAGRRVYDESPGHGWFDPTEPVADLAGNLPHWRQEAVTYFVTFRLADSLPQAKLRQWLAERDAWLAAHPKPWDEATRQVYHRQFTARLEKWLDAGYGSCLLEREDVRATVARALLHFDGDRYWLDDWVVMPNHVHVLLTPQPGYELSQILHSWKSFTSHEVRRLVSGWQGSLWQKESFDHIVRSPDHLERFRAYIARNPAGLDATRYTRSVDATSRRGRVEAEGRRRTAGGADRVASLRGDVDEDGITRRDAASTDEEGITRRDAASTNESGPELLARILAERRRKWEQEQLAAFAKAGKTPPAKWKEKYKEPAGPDCAKLPALPEGWCWASVEQLLLRSEYGTSVKCSYDASGPPVLRIPNIAAGAIDLSDLKFSTQHLEVDSESALQRGDMLVCRTNGSISLLGKTALISDELQPAHSFASYLLRFRFVQQEALPGWVHLFMSSHPGRVFIEGHAASSAGQHNISLSLMHGMPIPLPPISEQREILCLAEERLSLVAREEAQIEVSLKRSDRLRQAILRRAFEGKLVPQDPSDEPASKLLERIKANRTRLAERGDGKHKRRDAASTVDAASRRVTKDGGRASG